MDGYLIEAGRMLADDLEIEMAGGGGGRAALLADEWAHADAVGAALTAASDLIGDGSPLLVSPSADLLDAVEARWSAERACDFILTSSTAAAVDVVNLSNPSHLSVFAVDPMSVLSSIDISGEIDLRGARMTSLLSPAAPRCLSRCRSSLSVFDFLKRTSINYRTATIAADVRDDGDRADMISDRS